MSGWGAGPARRSGSRAGGRLELGLIERDTLVLPVFRVRPREPVADVETARAPPRRRRLAHRFLPWTARFPRSRMILVLATTTAGRSARSTARPAGSPDASPTGVGTRCRVVQVVDQDFKGAAGVEQAPRGSTTPGLRPARRVGDHPHSGMSRLKLLMERTPRPTRATRAGESVL